MKDAHARGRSALMEPVMTDEVTRDSRIIFHWLRLAIVIERLMD